MPKSPSKKKGKTTASAKASAKPKGARGNHAAFFAPLPQTPPRKSKRLRVISDDKEEPPMKKTKSTSKHTDADPDAGDPDRQAAVLSACQNRRHSDARNPLPSPRSSSPPRSSSNPPSGPDHGSSHPSQRLAPAPHQSSLHDPGHDSSSRHRTTHHPNPSLPSSSHNPAMHTSSRHPVSNVSALHNPSPSNPAPASNPVPASPGRSFADSLNTFKTFATQDQDPDDLDLHNETACKFKVKRILITQAGEDEPDDEDEENTDDEGEGKEEDEDEDEDEDDNTAHPGDNDDDEELSEEAVDNLMTIIRSRKKKKYSLSKRQSKSDHLPGHFKKWGRHRHCILGMYTDVFKTITTGLMVLKVRPQTAEEYNHCYKAVPNMSAGSAKFYTKKFMHLCDVVPKLKALCGHLLFRSGDMFIFAKFFKKHAGAGRSTDISTLKRNFASYLPTVKRGDDWTIYALSQAQYAGNKKAQNGGYYSVCTGRLVLPIHERADFDLDPVMYNKMKLTQRKAHTTRKHHQNNRRKPSNDEKSYPAFLFPTHFQYNERIPQCGIFKNTLCRTIVEHLFKGPTGVGQNDGASNDGNTCLLELYSITKMTPNYLVYTATLTRHLLSIDGHWHGDDSQRSGHRFHVSLHCLLTTNYEAWEEDVASGDIYKPFDEDELDENIFSYYNRAVFRAEVGNPQEQAADERIDDKSEDEDSVHGRIQWACKAELEARHRRRAAYVKSKQCASPSQTPEPQFLPRAQSLDYTDVEARDQLASSSQFPGALDDTSRAQECVADSGADSADMLEAA